MKKKAESEEVLTSPSNKMWDEIRNFYESSTHPNYEKIKLNISSKLKLITFPSKRTVERRAVKERWRKFRDVKHSKIAPNRYSDEFWLCARSVYESSPKMTYKQLKKLIEKELNCKYFPSQQAIAYKAKHQGWKRSDYLLKNSDAVLKKLVRDVKGFENEINHQIIKNSIKNHELECMAAGESLNKFDLKEEISKRTKCDFQEFFMRANIRTKNQADIVMIARKRMRAQNALGDLLSDQLARLFILMSSYNFKNKPSEKMNEHINAQLNILSNFVDIYKKFSLNSCRSLKFEMSLYGIELHDLRDKEFEKAIKDLGRGPF